MEVSHLTLKFSTDGVARTRSDISSINSGLDSVQEHSRRTSSAFGSVFKIAGGLLAGGALIGLFQGAKGLLMMDAAAEQAHMSLETVVGSASKADAIFKSVQDFAASTPFEFPELLQSTIAMEGFGLSSQKWLPVIGDTAAALGKSLDQVTQAVLDATNGQYERLNELGIKARVEGDKLVLSYFENGKTITETVDKNNQEIIADTISGIWNKKYEGAMKKQSKTFIGQFSTLKDNISMRLQEMSQGVFGFATKSMAFFNDIFALGFLNAVRGTFGRGVSDFIAQIGGMAGAFISAFQSGVKVNDLVKRFPEPLQAVAKAALLVADGFGYLLRVFKKDGLSGVLRELPDILGQVAEGLIRGLIGPQVLKFAFDTAVSIGGWLWDHKDDIWGGIKALIGWTADTFTDAITATISGTIALGGDLLDAAGDLYGWVKQQLFGANAGMGDGTGAVGALAPITFGDVVVEAGIVLGGKIADAAGDLYGWVAEQLGVTSGGGSGTAKGMPGGPSMGGAAPITLEDVGINIGSWLISATETLADAVKDKITEWWPTVKDSIGDTWDAALEIGEWLIEGGSNLFTAVSDKIEEWWPIVQDSIGDAWEATLGIGTWLIEGGSNLFTAVSDKIEEWWPIVQDSIGDAWEVTLGIGSWVIQQTTGLGSAVIAKVIEWWPTVRDVGHDLPGYIIDLTELAVGSIAGWASTAVTDIQTWLDTNQLSGFTQIIKIDAFSPTFEAIGIGDYQTAVQSALTADPIKITPEIELDIKQAVADWVAGKGGGEGGGGGDDFGFGDVWNLVTAALENAMLIVNPVAAFSNWVANTIVPDAVAVVRGALSGLFEGLTRETPEYDVASGTFGKPNESILQGVTDDIVKMFTDLPGRVKAAVGQLTLEIDIPKLPPWLNGSDWKWITDPIAELAGYIAELLGLKSQAEGLTQSTQLTSRGQPADSPHGGDYSMAAHGGGVFQPGVFDVQPFVDGWTNGLRDVETALGGFTTAQTTTQTTISTSYTTMATDAATLRATVANTFVGLRTDVTTIATTLRTTVANEFVGLRTDVTVIAQDLSNQAVNTFVGLRDQLVSLAGLARSAVVNEFVGMRNDILSILGGLASAAGAGGNAIGNALGSGIYSGMAAWVGSIASLAANTVAGAIAAARAAAGNPSSPSPVTFKRVGSPLGEGIYEGIKAWHEKTRDAMGDLASPPMGKWRLAGAGSHVGPSGGWAQRTAIAPSVTYIITGSIVGGDLDRYIDDKVATGQAKRIDRSVSRSRLAESY